MLQSVRDQIITAFCDALGGDGGPQFDGANIPVYRSPTSPVHRDDSVPCYTVTPVQEIVEPFDHATQLRRLSLHVVCIVGDPGTDQEAIDQKVEPLTSWAESKIFADENFGELAHRAEVTSIAWHIDSADEDYIGAEMTIEIQYYTARNAPDTRGDANE